MRGSATCALVLAAPHRYVDELDKMRRAQAAEAAAREASSAAAARPAGRRRGFGFEVDEGDEGGAAFGFGFRVSKPSDAAAAGGVRGGSGESFGIGLPPNRPIPDQSLPASTFASPQWRFAEGPGIALVAAAPLPAAPKRGPPPPPPAPAPGARAHMGGASGVAAALAPLSDRVLTRWLSRNALLLAMAALGAQVCVRGDPPSILDMCSPPPIPNPPSAAPRGPPRRPRRVRARPAAPGPRDDARVHAIRDGGGAAADASARGSSGDPSKPQPLRGPLRRAAAAGRREWQRSLERRRAPRGAPARPRH